MIVDPGNELPEKQKQYIRLWLERYSRLRLVLRQKLEVGKGLNVGEAQIEFEQGLTDLLEWARGRITKGSIRS